MFTPQELSSKFVVTNSALKSANSPTSILCNFESDGTFVFLRAPKPEQIAYFNNTEVAEIAKNIMVEQYKGLATPKDTSKMLVSSAIKQVKNGYQIIGVGLISAKDTYFRKMFGGEQPECYVDEDNALFYSANFVPSTAGVGIKERSARAAYRKIVKHQATFDRLIAEISVVNPELDVTALKELALTESESSDSEQVTE